MSKLGQNSHGFPKTDREKLAKKKKQHFTFRFKKKEQIFTTFGQHFWEVFLLCNTSIPEHLWMMYISWTKEKHEAFKHYNLSCLLLMSCAVGGCWWWCVNNSDYKCWQKQFCPFPVDCRQAEYDKSGHKNQQPVEIVHYP